QVRRVLAGRPRPRRAAVRRPLCPGAVDARPGLVRLRGGLVPPRPPPARVRTGASELVGRVGSPAAAAHGSAGFGRLRRGVSGLLTRFPVVGNLYRTALGTAWPDTLSYGCGPCTS